MSVCTCDDDPRHCERHPYVYEGPNGVPRGRKDYSPNSRMTATLADRLSSKSNK